MKKTLTLITIILLIAGVAHNLISSPDGAPSGYAYDKSSNFRTCAYSGCHSGTSVIADTTIAKITSNIPSTGYIPGQTYTFTATVTKPGYSRFGFQASPQDSLGNYKGTMIVTNTTKTKITGTKYITHTQSGNSQSSWSWNWVAPALGSGQVKMSGALMAANNNGSTSGDSTYKVSVTINECFKAPTGIVATPKGVSVAISWTKISCATGYKIMYHAVGAATWKYITLPDTATKAIYGLNYSTDYEYAIASINGTTLSAYSATKYFTTLCQCDLPIMVVDSVGSTALKFLWVDDNCGLRYKIQYRKSGLTFWTTKIVGDTTDNWIATNLKANTNYEWRYRRECNATGTYGSVYSTIYSTTTAPSIQVPDLIKITVIGDMKIYQYSDGSIKKVISH
jgi:hypothetical protein